jgi:hypothetical protein
VSHELIVGGSMDERYIRLLITRSQRLKLPPSPLAQKLPPSGEQEEDQCRACKLPVDMGDILGIAKCDNGHHWCKSSLSLLICASKADVQLDAQLLVSSSPHLVIEHVRPAQRSLFYQVESRMRRLVLLIRSRVWIGIINVSWSL